MPDGEQDGVCPWGSLTRAGSDKAWPQDAGLEAPSLE